MEGNKKEVLTMLQEMGFTEDRANRAYIKAEIKTVEGILNIIESVPEEAPKQ